MIKIGIYGGAFDPVHIGHVRLARQAAAELKLDKLLIIPTSVSPHKENAQTSYDDRFRMLELAFAQDKKFEISDIEKHISGKSFTTPSTSISATISIPLSADSWMGLLYPIHCCGTSRDTTPLNTSWA